MNKILETTAVNMGKFYDTITLTKDYKLSRSLILGIAIIAAYWRDRARCQEGTLTIHMDRGTMGDPRAQATFTGKIGENAITSVYQWGYEETQNEEENTK